MKPAFFGQHGVPNEAKVMWVCGCSWWYIFFLGGRFQMWAPNPYDFFLKRKRGGRISGFDQNLVFSASLSHQAVLLVVEIIMQFWYVSVIVFSGFVFFCGSLAVVCYNLYVTCNIPCQVVPRTQQTMPGPLFSGMGRCVGRTARLSRPQLQKSFLRCADQNLMLQIAPGFVCLQKNIAPRVVFWEFVEIHQIP